MRKKINPKVLAIFVINILLILLLCAVGLSDETTDDLGVQLFISGYDGIATYYHQWTSAFRILTAYALQRLFPWFAWNFVIQVIFIFISIDVICVEIMRKLQGKAGIALAAFTAVILFFQTVSTFNFTRTAALIMCAGLCLLLHEKRSEKWCGGILFVYAITVRISIICISVGFVAIILLWYLVNSEGSLSEKIRKILKPCIIPIAAAYAAALLVELIGQAYMTAQPEWRKFYDRAFLSGEVMDFGLEDYEDAAQMYEQLGISENDYNMVAARFSNSDSTVFTDDMYHQIIEHSSKKWKMEYSSETIKGWCRSIGTYLVRSCFGWYVLGALFLALAYYKGKKKWLPLLTIACLGAYLLMFCIMGRVVNRVIFGVYLCAGITLLICYDPDDLSDRAKKIGDKLQACRREYVFYLFLAVFTVFMGVKHQRSLLPDIIGIYDYMEEHEDNFFFYTKFSEYRAVDNLMLMSDYWDTGNTMYSSDYDTAQNNISKFQKYGITNIYKDAVDSDMIRIIDNTSIDMIETFIQEHYCESARAVKIDDINGYNVYKIVSE